MTILWFNKYESIRTIINYALIESRNYCYYINCTVTYSNVMSSLGNEYKRQHAGESVPVCLCEPAGASSVKSCPRAVVPGRGQGGGGQTAVCKQGLHNCLRRCNFIKKKTL